MTPITPIPATFEDFVCYTNNLIKERERELWCLTPLSAIFQLYRILILIIFFFIQKKKRIEQK